MENDFKAVSTSKPFWERDCDECQQKGVPFKISGISTAKHRRFVAEFAARHDWVVAHGDGTAYLSPPELKQRPPTSHGAVPHSGNATTESAKQKKTFLVIEDSADDALLIRRAFDALESCQAIICRNLSEARAYLSGAGIYANRAEYPFPNAIICDLHIGFESGVQCVEWIKQHPDFNEMPVFIFTGDATTAEASAAKKKGAVDVLKKPSKYEELRIMLRDLAAKLC